MYIKKYLLTFSQTEKENVMFFHSSTLIYRDQRDMQCDDDDHGRCINKSGSNIDNRGKMSNSHRAPALTKKK